MALPSEIGLYFDFEVTDDGVPYGCPGFETFKPENWNTSSNAYISLFFDEFKRFLFADYGFTWSCLPTVPNPDPNNGWHWKKADPNCPLNSMQVPDGSTPLHEIFEEYAADQQKWINDFVPTLEKMLSNGYAENELVDAPDQYTGIHCKRQEVNDYNNYYNCFNPDELLNESEPFYLISRWHGKAIEGKSDGYGKVMSFDIDNPRQQWIETKIGNQFINVGTGLPLFAGNGRAWIFGEEHRVVDPFYGQAIWVPWADEDGGNIGCSIPDESWKNPTQMFIKLTKKAVYEPLEGQRIMIQSEYDGRVIEGKPNGDGVMSTINENLNQVWVKANVENGIQFVNVGTKLPLMIQDVSVWTYTDQMTIEDADSPGMGIDRGWGQVDGQAIWLYKIWYGVIHRFHLIDV